MSIPSNDEYLAYLLSQRPPRKRGCVSSTIEFLCTVAVVALAVVGGWALLTMFLDTPVAPPDFRLGEKQTPTAQMSPRRQPEQQPISVPAPQLPDCATVQDTRTACQRVEGDIVPPSTTPTAEPTPTAEGFWTAEEQAAFSATAEAYYNPETLPTAPPAFVQAVQEGCQNPTAVAQSKLLQTWCADE